MKTSYQSKLLALYLGIWTALMPMLATAEDIDIFTGASAGTSANPNILIVIDNTSNWSRQSQQWPGGIAQGQSEANAIKTVVQALGAKGANVNIGLMEFVTNGNANDQGGFIRYAIRPMTSTNVSNFSTKLNTIYNNISSPSEKRSANTPYGDLMYDVYNHYAGAFVSNDGSNASQGLNPPNDDTDSGGYTANYGQFKSPVSATNSCARNFVIFIGNPNTNGPASDSTANSCALATLSGGTASCASGKFSPQLGLPNFSSVGSNVYTPLGQTAQCYPGAQVSSFNTAIDTCVAGNAASCYSSTVSTNYVTSTSTTNSSVTGCSPYTKDCNLGAAASSTYPTACASGTQSYTVVQTGTATTGPTPQTHISTSANSTVCYPTLTAAQAGVAAGDHAGLTCPTATEVISTVGSTTTITDTTHSCTYAAGSLYSSCSSPNVVTSSASTACYSTGAAPVPTSPATSSSIATATTLTCPAGYDCSYADTGQAAVCSGTPSASSSTTTSCYATAPSTNVATVSTLTCPAGYLCSYASSSPVATGCSTQTATGTTTSQYSSTPAITSPSTSSSLTTSPTLTCPSGFSCNYSVGTPAVAIGTTATADSYNCYAATPTLTSPDTSPGITTQTALACPANSTCTYTASAESSSIKDGKGKTCGATGSTGSGAVYLITQKVSTTVYPVTQTTTTGGNKYTITQTPINNYAYTIQQTAVAHGPGKYSVIQTDTPSVSVTTNAATNLGQSSQCFASAPTYTWSGSSDYSSQCTGRA